MLFLNWLFFIEVPWSTKVIRAILASETFWIAEIDRINQCSTLLIKIKVSRVNSMWVYLRISNFYVIISDENPNNLVLKDYPNHIFVKTSD